MKTLIKLVLAALIVHACWKSGSAYFRFYKLEDGAHAAALFAGQRSTAEIHTRVVEIARELEVPLDPEKLIVRREPNHTYIDTAYTEQIEIVPRYFYPWVFKLHLDVFTLGAPGDADVPAR
jgi:hypothetical protein